MRAISPKSYAVPGLGASLAHHHFAVVTGDLCVTIDSKLSWSDDSPLRDSVVDSTLYTLRLKSTFADVESNVVAKRFAYIKVPVPSLNENNKGRNVLLNLAKELTLTYKSQKYTLAGN